tara:strand:+ start:88 stop:375 length:288 start_codon:yes stop_codon:yes gene_type:complete
MYLTKKKSIDLLQRSKIKFKILAQKDYRFIEDAKRMIAMTNEMIKEVRYKGTRIDIEILEQLTEIFAIDVESEYRKLLERENMFIKWQKLNKIRR